MSKDPRPAGLVRVPQDLQKSEFNAKWILFVKKCYSGHGIDLLSWNLLEEKENIHPSKESISIQRDHLESNSPADDSDLS